MFRDPRSGRIHPRNCFFTHEVVGKTRWESALMHSAAGVRNEIEVLPLSPNDDRIRMAAYRTIYGDTALNRYAHQAVPPIHLIVKNNGTNAKDIERRHIWMVPTSGGTPRQISTGDGIETSPQPLASGKRLAVLYFNAATPASVGIVPVDGGLPKGPWVRLESGQACAARLTSQRFGLDASQVKDSWSTMPRHPYRTAGARRFIRLCKIQ
jgi:hypothetical protein